MFSRPFARLLACRGGGIGVMTAIVLPVLFGLAAVGVDVSSWYLQQRTMQGGADAAAVSAAAAYVAGDDPVSEGKSYAAQNGWTDGVKQTSVTIAPNLTASPQYIDADITQVMRPIFASLLPPVTMPTIRAHARVILVDRSVGGAGCLIGLGAAVNGGAIQISGQGFVNAPQCVIASDTNTVTVAPSCLNVNPACVTMPNNSGSGLNVAEIDVATRAPFVCPPGGNATCTIPIKRSTYPLRTQDPFAARQMPSRSPCPANDPTPSTSAAGVTTYNPGTYCHGISISGAASNVVFNGGLYFLGGTNNSTASNFTVTGGAINQTTVTAATIATAGTGYKKNDTLTVTGGAFVFPTTFKVSTVNGAGAITAIAVTSGAYTTSTPANPATVTGGTGSGARFTVTYAVPPATGLTFILSGSAANSVGSVSLANATITLIGMSTGPTQTLIFWQDKKGTAANGFSGNPSARVTLQGALYFPNATLSVAGNSTFIPTTCTAIVAKMISFTGQASITKGCLGIGGGTGGSMSAFRMAD